MSAEDLKLFRESIEKLITSTNDKIDSFHTTIKTDIGTIRNELAEHNTRIEKVESEVKSNNNNGQIEELQLQIELLKQDRLRNNIRITGLPPIAFNDPDEAILRIDSILKADLVPSDYTFHTDRNKSSLIVSFTSQSLKRYVMEQMRNKQNLFVRDLW